MNANRRIKIQPKSQQNLTESLGRSGRFRLDASAQFGAAASPAAILRPSGSGVPWAAEACESMVN